MTDGRFESDVDLSVWSNEIQSERRNQPIIASLGVEDCCEQVIYGSTKLLAQFSRRRGENASIRIRRIPSRCCFKFQRVGSIVPPANQYFIGIAGSGACPNYVFSQESGKLQHEEICDLIAD
jgi:hypothetical protein